MTPGPLSIFRIFLLFWYHGFLTFATKTWQILLWCHDNNNDFHKKDLNDPSFINNSKYIYLWYFHICIILMKVKYKTGILVQPDTVFSSFFFLKHKTIFYDQKY